MMGMETKAEVMDCEPVAVMDDGWSEWIHPLPGFLMQCCDCGLVHEMQAAIGKDNGVSALNEGERRNGRVVLFRVRRKGIPSATAMLNAAAPDLLAACQAYAVAYDCVTGTIHVNTQIRAAIERATAAGMGEQDYEPSEMPTIWEDPAGKGYPCFERPMTPAEARETIERLGSRVVALENENQQLRQSRALDTTPTQPHQGRGDVT